MTAQQRDSRIMSISVPPEMYHAIENAAHEENRTRSDLIREAFRHYQFARQWRLIRQWGEETAVRLDLETDDELEALLG